MSNHTYFNGHSIFQGVLMRFHRGVGHLLGEVAIVITMPHVGGFLIFTRRGSFNHHQANVSSRVDITTVYFGQAGIGFNLNVTVTGFFRLFFIIGRQVREFYQLGHEASINRQIGRFYSNHQFFFTYMGYDTFNRRRLQVFEGSSIFFFGVRHLSRSLTGFTRRMGQATRGDGITLGLVTKYGAYSYLVSSDLGGQDDRIFLAHTVISRQLGIDLNGGTTTQNGQVGVHVSFYRFIRAVNVNFRRAYRLVGRNPNSTNAQSIRFLFGQYTRGHSFNVFTTGFGNGINLQAGSLSHFNTNSGFLSRFRIRSINRTRTT